jgi:two-component system sensor histidine kinase YesM
MFLALAFTVFVLLVFYFVFSGKMSEPARKLKKAMQKVQKGDFSVRVDVKNEDEMGYLSDGFNKMVNDLQYYIEQVYEARLYQKEAELKL